MEPNFLIDELVDYKEEMIDAVDDLLEPYDNIEIAVLDL